MEYPKLLRTALDTTGQRGLAEFYRELLGLRVLADLAGHPFCLFVGRA